MRRVLSVVALSLVALCALAQEPSNTAPKASSISGRVIKAGTSEPIRKAKLTLAKSNAAGDQDSEQFRESVSDQNGDFRFEAVAPGTYSLYVERPGFTGDKRMLRFGTDVRKSVTVEPGKNISDLVIALIPSATITGRVVDQDGDPMPHVSISALRYQYQRARRTLVPVQSGETDDRGEYRIFGLSPGSYFLSASPRAEAVGVVPADSDPAKKTPKLRYPTTYYPGVLAQADATPLKLGPGEESAADFSLAAVPTVKVSGKVVGLGASFQGMRAVVSMHPVDLGSMEPQAPALIKEGQDTFTFDGVLPGEYLLNAVSAESMAKLASTSTADAGIGFSSSAMSAGRKVIDVGTTDLSGIVLSLQSQKPVSLHGRVVVDSGKSPNLEQLYIAFTSINWRKKESTYDLDMTGFAQPKKDGSFEAQNVPSETVFPVIGAQGTGWEDYYTKSVLVGGRDVSDTGIHASSGSAPVEIVISADGGRLSGTVTDGRSPLSDATVVIVPEPSRRVHSDLYLTAKSDQKGQFTIRGIRPGAYTAYAFADASDIDGAWYYDDFLRPFESKGKSLTIQEKATQQLTLVAIPPLDPQ